MESRVQPHSQTYGRDEEGVIVGKTIKPYLWLGALVLAGILPFAARAVYMDEPQYLHVARSVLERDWRFPQDTPWLFFGRQYANIAAQTHLPVVEYYLAIALGLLHRFDEVKFRLLFAVFPLLAAAGFYRLARRFTARPLLVSILFISSPVFFVLSPALMMDIPMIAFLLAGLALYLDHVERPATTKPLLFASVCFILAAGTGYTVLVPLGCLFVWAVAAKRPKSEWLAIAAAPAAICVWLAVMSAHFGESPVNELVGYYTSHSSFDRILLPMFSFVGGVAAFPWSHLAFAPAGRRFKAAMLSLVAAVILSFFHTWPSIGSRLWFVVLAASGISLLVAFAVNARRRHPFLILWLPASLLFFLLFAEMISARYLLLSLPPLLLVVFAEMRGRAAACAIAGTLILSAGLAIGDYRFVGSYPRWVEENVVPLQRQGFRVWNAGESGLRFYMEQRGIQTLDTTDTRPQAGDLIVRQTSFRYGLSKDLEPLLVNILKTDLTDFYPIQTFSRDAGAGFHDSHLGLVPFSFSLAPLDRLEIDEVSPFAVKLPQEVPPDFSSVPVWFPGGVLLKQTRPEMKFSIRIPRDARVEYELEGHGSVALSSEGILLKKENAGPVLWKNFRIVPGSWP